MRLLKFPSTRYQVPQVQRLLYKSLQRVQKHLILCYGWDLKFSQTGEWLNQSAGSWAPQPLSQDVQENDEYLRFSYPGLPREKEVLVVGGALVLPFFYNGQFLGAARLTPIKKLAAEEVRKVIVITRLLLTEILKQFNLIEMLERVIQGQNQALSPSVKTIVKFRRNRNFDPRQKPKVSKPESVPAARTPLRPYQRLKNFKLPHLTFPALIEGNNPDNIHALALELHTCIPGQIAFVHFSQLNESVTSNVEQLKSLAGVTIFIPNLFELSPAQVEVLVRFLQKPVQKTGNENSNTEAHMDSAIEATLDDIKSVGFSEPVVIAGTHVPYSLLVAQDGQSARLAALIRQSHFRVPSVQISVSEMSKWLHYYS